MSPITARSVSDLDFGAVTGRPLTPSPSAWEDEVLYFLLVDRFSDGREAGYLDLSGQVVPGATPAFEPADAGSAITSETHAAAWRAAGVGWAGGTVAGIKSKLGYLRRLGVTALWISPLLKQAHTPAGAATSYHGYAIQDFLSVDPHFGSNDELADLVAAAHAAGLRVILDVVLNHVGDVFAYDLSDPARYPSADPADPAVDPRWDGHPYPVKGWREGDGSLAAFTAEAAAAQWPDGAVFPAELHPPQTFSREGHIVNWDYPPEYLNGDFAGLKDVTHGAGAVDDYLPSPALKALTRAYCWWIAFADLDGFRLDTVKHLDRGATRFFTSVVHEFAQSIGKDRFFLVGEITGSRGDAIATMELTGLDAALGLADVQQQLAGAAAGRSDPSGYFALFRNSELIGKDSQTWLRNTVVTSYDDHDQVWKGPNKARFCADPDGLTLATAVLALNAASLGIPCIYYGSEQGLDGSGAGPYADRYIREAMFGGEFGPFRSRGRHVFDEGNQLYVRLAAVLRLRAAEPAMRRGRQYLRQISADGLRFALPWEAGQVPGILAWSRILADRELLCAINTDPAQPREVWATIDDQLHRTGEFLTLLHASSTADVGPAAQIPAARIPVEDRNGRAARLVIPPGAFAVYG